MELPDKTDRLLRSLRTPDFVTGEDSHGFVVPNLSGDLSQGIVRRTPTEALDPVNKAYADTLVGGGAPEGTAVLSTGESGGVKFLRENGDGTSSWQVGPFAAALGADDNYVTDAEKAALHAAVTLASSATDGGLSLSTQQIGFRAATNAQTGYATAAQITALEAASAHVADNTQAHSDYLLNSEADVGVGLTLTGDNSSADTAYVPMVLYNTDATPPTASTVPIGTIYIQYTA